MSTVSRRNAGSSALVPRVCDALQNIYWSGTIRGFPAHEPISSLSLYATQDWFTDVQQSQLIELLQSDVLNYGRALQDEVCDIWMMEFIRAAWREQEKYAQPDTFQQYPRAKAMGAVLAAGEREQLAITVNLHNLHWVSAVIKCKEHQILWGDPFKAKPDSDSKRALDWWTFHHTGRQFSWGKRCRRMVITAGYCLIPASAAFF
ncbi:hypothetical protein C8F04DRAFT_1123651 [Mycena alexandri]|uniref:Ubiquitin-like protease family profile domain-containing protein n=1 Tax=Mycena alexandri TaxID=1745969 RepID=A0AAD6WZT2_9AGAR|nr:hypothetical protein C8F04DRAFT_1123651 [Mycena alexandri]